MHWTMYWGRCMPAYYAGKAEEVNNASVYSTVMNLALAISLLAAANVVSDKSYG